MKYRIIKETLKNGTVNYYAQEQVISIPRTPLHGPTISWEYILPSGTQLSERKQQLFSLQAARNTIDGRKNYLMATDGQLIESTEIIEELS